MQEKQQIMVRQEFEFLVPLKDLSKFWRILDMPSIICEINLILTWSEDCVITDAATQAAGAPGNPSKIRAPRDAALARTDPKPYVPVVIFPTKDDYKLFQQQKNRI